MRRRNIITALALVISCGLTVFAQTPQFNIIKPTTTGVPGEEVRVMKFDPNGQFVDRRTLSFFGRIRCGDATA